MKFQVLLFCTLLFYACGDTGGNASISESQSPIAETTAPSKAAPATPSTAPASQPVRDKHDCKLIGKFLEDTEFWLPKEELLFVVVADTAELYDKDFPDSYRSFQVYDTKKCDLIGNHVMPANKSPDFPYYLYPNTYEPVNRVICAQGTDFVYCYDMQRKEMLLPMIPEYQGKRRSIDASSGNPQGLTVWGHYLFGYATDHGAYGFDLKDKRKIKNFVPVAEYLHKETGEMNQLFMAESSPGEFQALYSSFDANAEENALQIKPLFEQPLPINTRMPSGARNNNWLVFKFKDGSSAVGIDMDKGVRKDLPAEIASQPVQEIISWMKSH